MFLPLGQKLPVTAVALFNNFLLSAQGKCVEVTNISTSKHDVTESFPLLDQSVIHGLKTFIYNDRLHVLAFGGKELCLVKSHLDLDDDIGFEVLHKRMFHDWILDVAVVNKNDVKKPKLAIALAHNSVLVYDWSSSTMMEEVHCSDKCILYSACFINLNRSSWKDLILCSGTVFNQIIIWKPSGAKESGDKILKRLNGHDGVIFDICFNYKKRLLLSASDDRSIRVWDCAFLSNLDKLNDNTDNCLCVMYGHEARIWKVNSFLKDGELFVVSVAEDGLCIVWKLLSNVGNLVTSSIVKKMNFRANLLSLSDIDNEKFVTGGCDGSIRLVSLRRVLQHQDCVETPAISKDEHGTIKTVALLRRNELAVLSHTDRGSLLLFWIEKRLWKILEEDENFGSYVVMKLNVEETYAGLGNTKGLLKILHINSEYEIIGSHQIQIFNSKVLGVNWSGNNVFASGPDGKLLWYIVNYDGNSINVDFVSSFLLPPSKHRWSTAVVFHTDDMFVCGDRRGSIHLFKKGQTHPLQTFHGIHGKLGVTSLSVHDSKLTSTGRDGHWRSWLFNRGELVYQTQHRSAQGMEWIEGCDVGDDETRLLIYGFHGNKFIVWSRYSGDELFSMQCGGGHRSWDFSLPCSCFVFLKAGKLNVVKTSSPIHTELAVSSSFHSQHINCVRHLANYQHAGRRVFILATSGEDTKVILSSLTMEESCKHTQMRSHHVLDDHLSNVRCVSSLLVSSSDAISDVLMVTGGGRAMLHVYLVKIKKNSNLNNISVRHLTSYTCGAQESETRFMAISLWLSDNRHYMAVACSDGRIRLLEINGLNDAVLIGATKEYDHCFLTVSRLDDYLFCGSTDGRVYVMSSSLDEVTSYVCHQSGVNALALCDVTIDDNDYVISVTGGDDNAIQVYLLDSSKNTYKPISSVKISSAHSTQVTGLHVEKLNSSLLRMSSVSIDQRIIRWEMSISEDRTLMCDELECTLTYVADVASMDVCGNHHFICGQGLSHHLYIPQEKIIKGDFRPR